MNILIFDTETTNLEKPFCYNIGFCIYDTDKQEIIYSNDFVVEQVWNNKMLFPTSYYLSDTYNDKGELIKEGKRNLYISKMRTRKTILEKYGYICQKLSRLAKIFNIQSAYAFNSDFDWFKCKNPFDNINIFDIRGYALKTICFTEEYKNFCENNRELKNADGTAKFFTETDNYKSTAETVYSFLTNNPNYQEEHTALEDSLIETEILKYCLNNGCELNTKYPLYNSIPRNNLKKLIIVENKIELATYEYTKKIERGEKIFLYNNSKKEE